MRRRSGAYGGTGTGSRCVSALASPELHLGVLDVGENRHIRHVLELTVLAVIFIAVAIEHEVVAGMSIKELTFVGVAVVLGLGLGAAILSWIYSQPEQLLGNMRVAFEEFKGDSIQLNSEFKSLLTQTLEKQPFVSEDVLAIIEERADTIWVVTTDLRNDVMPGKIEIQSPPTSKKGNAIPIFFRLRRILIFRTLRSMRRHIKIGLYINIMLRRLHLYIYPMTPFSYFVKL